VTKEHVTEEEEHVTKEEEHVKEEHVTKEPTHTQTLVHSSSRYSTVCVRFLSRIRSYLYMPWRGPNGPFRPSSPLSCPLSTFFFPAFCNQLNLKKWKTPMHDITKTDKDIMRIVTKESDLMRMKTRKQDLTRCD
jgi:hypothetical protein